jgi:hypothetical protein
MEPRLLHHDWGHDRGACQGVPPRIRIEEAGGIGMGLHSVDRIPYASPPWFSHCRRRCAVGSGWELFILH